MLTIKIFTVTRDTQWSRSAHHIKIDLMLYLVTTPRLNVVDLLTSLVRTG